MRDRDRNREHRVQRSWQYTCPICKRRATVPSRDSSKLPLFFPFCSERCKLIDLGAWLDADYRILGKPEEEPDHPPGQESSGETPESKKEGRV